MAGLPGGTLAEASAGQGIDDVGVGEEIDVEGEIRVCRCRWNGEAPRPTRR